MGDEIMDNNIEVRIKEVLDRIRPYLQNGGGDVTFKRFENGVVYVSLVGACSNCPMAAVTLEYELESELISEIPEVIKLVNK